MFPVTFQISNPTPYTVVVDGSFSELTAPLVISKLATLRRQFNPLTKTALVSYDLLLFYIFRPLKVLWLKLSNKPYYYVFLPALAVNDFEKTITLYPYALFQTSWEYVMGQMLNDPRSPEEKEAVLIETMRYYAAFSIAHELRHLEQPEAMLKDAEGKRKITKFIVIPSLLLVLARAVFIDVTEKKGLESLLPILFGVAVGILTAAIGMVFFYNRFFKREADANRYADKEVTAWMERVQITVNKPLL